MVTINRFYTVSVTIILLLIATLSFVAINSTIANASNRLPEDQYRLRLPNGNEANSDGLNCYISDPYHGDCTAFSFGNGTSHQYITISNGQINDSTRDMDYIGANYSYFTLITDSRSPKPISVDVVERAIASLGCQGYRLIADYYNPTDPNTSLRNQTVNASGCKNYSLYQMPISALDPVYENGKPTGYYRGLIRIKIEGDGNRQSSFHLNAGGGSDIGYAGFYDRVGARDANDKYPALPSGDIYGAPGTLGTDTSATYTGWINTYPTNAADGHRITYTFRPPCDITPGAKFDFSWDSLDWSSSFQPNKPTVRLIKHGRGGVDDNPQEVANYTDVGNQAGVQTRTITMNSSMFIGNDPGKQNPYALSVVFDGIRGGNGISFKQPFDSAYSQINCPDPTTPKNWDLRNNTEIVGKAASYSNANDGTPNRQNRAVSYFQSYRFTHNVWNLGPNTKDDADSEVYAYVRNGNRGDDNFDEVFKPALTTPGNPGAINGPIKPGDENTNNKSISRVASASQLRSSLYSGNRVPVAKMAWCAARTGTSTVPPTSNEPHCTVPDGNAWRWDRGDTYCEKVITHNFNSGRPGVDLNRPDPDGAYGPDPIKCVELDTTNNTPCFSLPWSISADRTNIRVLGASWNETGQKDYNDAWVGVTYDSWYILDKNGLAAQTSGITGEMTKVETDSAGNLGVWTSDGNMPGSPRVLTGPYGFSNGSRVINPADAGKTFYTHGKFSPGSADGYCNPGPAVDQQTSLYVPYYYHLKPQVTNNGPASVQQQSPVNIKATVSLPQADNQGDLSGGAAGDNEFGGRLHTNSKSTNIKVVQFETNDELAAKNAIPANKSGSAGPCADLGSFGIPGLAACDENAATSTNTFTPSASVDLNYTGNTGLKPVGTIICYVTAIDHPVDSPNGSAPAWRYSAPQCITVVKSPKVQFKNGDVSVGRYRFGEGGSPCASPDTSAIIQTADAPNYGGGTRFLYGSWVEYGAFSPGTVSGFGTSGTYASSPNAKRLMFSNTDNGKYVYGTSCIANIFKTMGSNVNTIPASTTLIEPADYFSEAGRNTIADDKDGYVTVPGKDLKIGVADITNNGGGGGAGAGATSGNTYTVKQCTSWTDSAPAGWTATGGPGGMDYSSGCNGDGGDHRIKVYWGQGVTLGNNSQVIWRFNAPNGTKLQSMSANQHTTVGDSPWTYSDPHALVEASDGTKMICYRFNNQCGNDTTQYVSYGFSDADWFQLRAWCSVNQEVYLPGYNNGTCRSDNAPTSVAMSDITLNLKDDSAPVVNDKQESGLGQNGGKYSGNAVLRISASDIGSGLSQYRLTAQGATTKTFTGGFGDGTCSSRGNTDNPTPCPATAINKDISINTKDLPIGQYNFSFYVEDFAGNKSATITWSGTVDNRSSLGANYDAFTGRNLVIYARKDSSKSCNSAGAGGNLKISTDITYRMSGYANAKELPRVSFLADCNIIIDDNVKQIDASLIAGDAIQTCTTVATNDQACKEHLLVNGLVQAQRLLLLRTAGADLSKPDASSPAETFNLRPDQILASYSHGASSARPVKVYEVDISPRY